MEAGADKDQKQAGRIRVPARMEYLEKALDFLNGYLRACSCDEIVMERIDMAVEELFTNISAYAYRNTGLDGDVEIDCRITGQPPRFYVCLADRGVPFNPLQRRDPDVSLPAERKPVGGLGIYMVKQFMDEVEYRYENGSNRISFIKTL